MIEIKSLAETNAVISVPGSKSYTHRMLIAAALADGRCDIRNWLDSEDTNLTLAALQQAGIQIEIENGHVVIYGRTGELDPVRTPIFLGNSGTSMRLLAGVFALGQGEYVLTGTARMQERPIQDLLDGLNQIGVNALSRSSDGCPPVEIQGGPIRGGNVRLNCSVSSQYLSALLLLAPYTRKGIEITVTEGPVSRPYIDITLEAMRNFGVEAERKEYEQFYVNGGQFYHSGVYTVEPDCSQAGYFWAAAAVTGSTVKVKNISRDSHQGDIRFLDRLESMGCRVLEEHDGIRVVGDSLRAIETDMADIPDVVPTLAVVAAFAVGTTVIRNVAHLQAKESNRMAAVVTELRKMGITAGYDDNSLWVEGGKTQSADIDTYDDHRIAMSFAIAGLRTPGLVIKNEKCVQKSFPNFWGVFEKLY